MTHGVCFKATQTQRRPAQSRCGSPQFQPRLHGLTTNNSPKGSQTDASFLTSCVKVCILSLQGLYTGHQRGTREKEVIQGTLKKGPPLCQLWRTSRGGSGNLVSVFKPKELHTKHIPSLAPCNKKNPRHVVCHKIPSCHHCSQAEDSTSADF